MKRIVCCGMSSISGLGFSIDESRRSLLESRSSMTVGAKYVQTRHSVPFAEVTKSNTDLAAPFASLTYDDARTFTRTSLLSLNSISQLLADTDIDLTGKRVVVVNGTTAGGIDRSEVYYKSMIDGLTPNIDDIKGHDPADSTRQIAAYLKSLDIKVANEFTLSTACSSSAVCVGVAVNLLQCGRADYVICGGVDPLSLFTINGFKSLGILSDSVCRPFDVDRSGLNLGEAASYLLLTTENERHTKAYFDVLSCETATDAFHQTATSPDAKGPTLAMSAAIKAAAISPSDIDYIHAHGTATVNNDLSESIAMKSVFGDNVPMFSSTKCYTGHTLGAAGATGIIASAISMQERVLFPTNTFEDVDPEIGLTPITTLTECRSIRTAMVNAFGFAGGATSIIIQKN